MKITVYTCITGSYDRLVDPSYVDPSIKYVAFINGRQRAGQVWTPRRINVDQSLGPVKTARKIKILSHDCLESEGYSVWVDGNIDIIGDVRELIESNDFPEFMTFKHPFRACLYDEAEACVVEKKDAENAVRKQVARYRREGYPENNGLIESGVLIRKMGSMRVRELESCWWNEVREGSRRDQLSFNYCAWKMGFTYSLMGEASARGTSKYFRLREQGPHRGEVTLLWRVKTAVKQLSGRIAR